MLDPRTLHYMPFKLKCPNCGAVEWFSWGANCYCLDYETNRFVEMKPSKFWYFLGWAGIVMPRKTFEAKKDWWK